MKSAHTHTQTHLTSPDLKQKVFFACVYLFIVFHREPLLLSSSTKMSKKKDSVEIEMTTGISDSDVLRFSPDSDDEDDGRGCVPFFCCFTIFFSFVFFIFFIYWFDRCVVNANANARAHFRVYLQTHSLLHARLVSKQNFQSEQTRCHERRLRSLYAKSDARVVFHKQTELFAGVRTASDHLQRRGVG